ncbi:MAG: glycogen debranching protein [Cyanobium sp. CACIAM 14]|nr:MAG: glycogen debranching protein [Cyanobium sp. CACIAM 14]
MGDERREWLETDGAGGFASGTACGLRTRRYHNLLIVATTPPTGRVALVGAVEAWVEHAGGREALSSHRYAPGVVHPDGIGRLVGFTHEPWPSWRWRLADGREVCHELLVPAGRPLVLLTWRLISSPAGMHGGLRLRVRPLLSGRDLHALHHENGDFRFEAALEGEAIVWRPYAGVPGVAARANGSYEPAPEWYRQFLYAQEQARGLDALEDLASPGIFCFALDGGEAVLVLAAAGDEKAAPQATPTALPGDPAALAEQLRSSEAARRSAFPSPLTRAADAYLVRRGEGRTVIAGYPWFTDWGRDTFIALRGLCIASGRLEEAKGILLAWASQVSEGMLPNRFAEQGDHPEFNSVDAALWFCVAVHELLAAAQRGERPLAAGERERLAAAVAAILAGYGRGTRFGIRRDADGLLAAGQAGLQLTWMDAKVGEWVVTPRIGKPVEIQALWVNALEIGAALGERARAAEARQAREAFQARFWNPERRCLFDVVDADHVPGTADPTLRANQILAVGGLPFPVLDGERAAAVVETVERELLTPLGLRSLAPGEPGYRAHYEGGVLERDGAYHQGTVWPWLMGPFVEAWLRVRGGSEEARREARRRFLAPLLEHLADAGLGHVSEITDAEAPFTPRGCPFQAWSVGEALRLERLLAPDGPAAPVPLPAPCAP